MSSYLDYLRTLYSMLENAVVNEADIECLGEIVDESTLIMCNKWIEHLRQVQVDKDFFNKVYLDVNMLVKVSNTIADVGEFLKVANEYYLRWRNTYPSEKGEVYRHLVLDGVNNILVNRYADS